MFSMCLLNSKCVDVVLDPKKRSEMLYLLAVPFHKMHFKAVK